jgi:endonuclease/exonuclease/phosphatase family metal-dependent hydrolase
MTRWQTAAVFVLTASAWVQASASEPLSCLRPVSGVTWQRWETERETLDLWCQSVGPPVFAAPSDGDAEITRLVVLSWNVHVGGGEVEALIDQILSRSIDEGTGLVVLLQETFRAGADVPESFPGTLRVPSAIRPRRPVPDVTGIANRFGLSVAYVPSMRNGSATGLEAREDRGNAVLSTEPLSDVRAIELPFGKQRRVSVAATVTPRGATPLRVVVTHFDTNGDRVRQADALAARLAPLLDLPVIVAGDLNARRGPQDRAVAVVSRLAALESCGSGRTSRWPLRLDVPLFFLAGRPDFVFSTLGPEVTRTCRTLPDAYDSDHLPLVMEMRVR